MLAPSPLVVLVAAEAGAEIVEVAFRDAVAAELGGPWVIEAPVAFEEDAMAVGVIWRREEVAGGALVGAWAWTCKSMVIAVMRTPSPRQDTIILAPRLQY